MKKLMSLVLILVLTLQAGAMSLTEVIDTPYPVIYEDIGYGAYTNGYWITIGTELAKDMNSSELAIIILHEESHIVYKHIDRKDAIRVKYCGKVNRYNEIYVRSCLKLKELDILNEYRNLEIEADIRAFKKAKSLGYGVNSCEMFINLYKHEGDFDSIYSTHPSLHSRYVRCIDMMR